MAWPPPTMPTTRTNTTVMTDTHPSEHNAVNLAINNIVAKVPWSIVTLNEGYTSGTTVGTTEAALMVTNPFDSVANRRYRIVAEFTGNPNTAGDLYRFHIRRGVGIAGTLVMTGPASICPLAGNYPYLFVGYDIPGAIVGNRYTITVVRLSGTGTFTMHAAANYYNSVAVEDIGTNLVV